MEQVQFDNSVFNVKPVPLEMPQNALANALKLAGARQKYEANAFALDNSRQEMARQNALAQILGRGDFNPQTPQGQAELYRAGGVKGAQTFMKGQADIDKVKSDASKASTETEIKVLGMHRDELSNVRNPQEMAQWMAAIRKDPRTTDFYTRMGSLDEAVARIPQTPQEFEEFRQKIAMGMTKYTEMNKPQFTTRNLGGSTDTIATDGMTGKTRVVNSALNTQSPDNKASVGASYANAAATRAVAASNVEAARMRRDQDTEMKLGDDYRAQSKDFKAVGDAYKQINATLDSATKSPAATLAAATKFMKLLDPGSVVRESELGMALAATGVFDRATNYVNTLQSGRVLTPNQVKDFKAITEQIYNAAQTGQKAIDKDYTSKATAYKLRPEMIVQDLGQNADSKIPATRSPQDAQALAWANANPNDPRAVKIKQRLGQ